MLNKNFPDKMFSIMPINVILDPDLSTPALRIYALISNIANSKGCCRAKNKYFQDSCEVEERTVSRALAQLSAKGYISIMTNKNARAIYLPFNARFQTTENNIPEPAEDVAPGVIEILQQIEAREKEQYPGWSLDKPIGYHGAIVKETLTIIAKAVYNSEYVGTKLSGRVVTEDDMKALIELIDIVDISHLAEYITEHDDEIFNIDRYILASVIKLYAKDLDKCSEDRKFQHYLDSRH